MDRAVLHGEVGREGGQPRLEHARADRLASPSSASSSHSYRSISARETSSRRPTRGAVARHASNRVEERPAALEGLRVRLEGRDRSDRVAVIPRQEVDEVLGHLPPAGARDVGELMRVMGPGPTARGSSRNETSQGTERRPATSSTRARRAGRGPREGPVRRVTGEAVGAPSARPSQGAARPSRRPQVPPSPGIAIAPRAVLTSSSAPAMCVVFAPISGLRRRAARRGCSDPRASWCPG